MYDNHVHSVEHRIVSISQPWLRPVIRGKAKVPVEFGAKLDLSLDSEGYFFNPFTCKISQNLQENAFILSKPLQLLYQIFRKNSVKSGILTLISRHYIDTNSCQ